MIAFCNLYCLFPVIVTLENINKNANSENDILQNNANHEKTTSKTQQCQTRSDKAQEELLNTVKCANNLSTTILQDIFLPERKKDKHVKIIYFH